MDRINKIRYNITPIPAPENLSSTHIEIIDEPEGHSEGLSAIPKRAFSSSFYVPISNPKHKSTVVIDLDETLVYARDGPIMIRPYSRLLLSLLRENFDDLEIIIWSAGTTGHVDRCLYALDPDEILINHAIGRGIYEDMIEASKKNLNELLGRYGRCIIVDNSPMVSIHNGSAALIIPDFEPHHEHSHLDTTLLFVLQIIARAHLMYTARMAPMGNDKPRFEFVNIGKYIEDNPYVSMDIIKDIIYHKIDAKDHEKVKYRLKIMSERNESKSCYKRLAPIDKDHHYEECGLFFS